MNLIEDFTKINKRKCCKAKTAIGYNFTDISSAIDTHGVCLGSQQDEQRRSPSKQTIVAFTKKT